MPTWTPIQYRGFWDVPRIFLVTARDRLFLFDCAFSEELDDYPDEYPVFELPGGRMPRFRKTGRPLPTVPPPDSARCR